MTAMYAWLWSKLPGPWPVRTLICIAAVTAVVVALFTWVFPAIEPWLNEPTLP